MIGTLHRFLWTAYDHLGGLVLLNLLWTLLGIPWLGLAALLLGLAAGLEGARFLAAVLVALELVLLSPPTLLLFLAGRCWAREEERSAKSLLADLKRLALRAQGLGLLVAGITAVLVVNLFFYRQFAGWIGLVLSGLMLWLLLALGMSAVFLFPLLAEQEGGIWWTARQSFLLAVDNVGRAVWLLLASTLFLGLGGLSGLGLFCGMLTGLALFISLSFRELMAKYSGEERPEPPRRSWRELIRPWES